MLTIFTTLGVVCLCRLTNGGGAWSRDKVQVRLHTEHGGTFIMVGNMQDMSEADEERGCASVCGGRRVTSAHCIVVPSKMLLVLLHCDCGLKWQDIWFI